MLPVMNMINQSLGAVSSWFIQVFNSSGMVEVYIAIIFLVFAIRFLIVPIFGRSRGSDKARVSGEGNSDE